MLRTELGFGRSASIIVALALCGALSASGATNAASRVASDPSKFAGAFVNWGPDGRELTLQAWEKWLKQPPSSVLGVDFYAQPAWEEFSRLTWVPGIWRKLNPARNVVWSVQLTAKGTG